MNIYTNGFRIATNGEQTEVVLHLTQNVPVYSSNDDMVVNDECVGAYIMPAPVAKALGEKLSKIFGSSAD